MAASRFKSIGKPKLLSQTVESAIEAAIRAGTFGVGERMPSEMELCEQFGVSRTVMREALRMLSARGLVDIQKGRGMFVAELSADSVSNPMELYLHMHSGNASAVHVVATRQLVEPPIARLAARHHTPDDAARMRANLAELVQSPEDPERMSALDMAFHLLIAEATHNPVLPLVTGPIQRLMPAIMKDVYRVVGDAHPSAVEGHTAIAEAIFDRDGDRAEAAMRRHLDAAMTHLHQTLDAA